MTPNITLEVSGMTCGSCARHVTSALTQLAGIAKVDVALRDGLVHVAPATAALDATQLGELTAQMIGALDRAGYAAKPRGA